MKQVTPRTGPKETFVGESDVPKQRDRPGFVSVCQYGSIQSKPNEIGGIFVGCRNVRFEHGLFVYDAECVERVFVKPVQKKKS